jgi:hypothetical protein
MAGSISPKARRDHSDSAREVSDEVLTQTPDLEYGI